MTTVPTGILTQHIAILGKTRSGKSSVMRGLVEGLLEREQPVCIVDPKGDWWGIKLAADGKRAGYPVVIFGGEHADIPINEHAGGPPSSGLDGPQQNILNVVAMLGVRGITPDRDCVARWLDLHPNGGRYGSNLAYLRTESYLEGFTLTEKGRGAARAMDSGIAAAKEPLDGPQREIVDLLYRTQQKYTRDTLADALGLHPNGGRYGSNLARLRTMGLIPERGDIYLTEAAHR